ncbi:MAG: putative papain-like cysteine peptidase, partial [Cyanobacteriota bacterium]
MTNDVINKKQCYNHVVSLGCACNTSLYLKKLGLKLFSLPYDWIFSNLNMIQ